MKPRNTLLATVFDFGIAQLISDPKLSNINYKTQSFINKQHVTVLPGNSINMFFPNKEFCVLHAQSNTTIFYLLVQEEYNYM